MGELYSPRIGILASGNGSTTERFIMAAHKGEVQADVALVVTNNGNAGVLGRVAALNTLPGTMIATHHISGKTHPEGPAGPGEMTDQESAAIRELMDLEGISLVLMLGYMKRVRGELMAAYGHQPGGPLARMANTHPAPYEVKGFFGVPAQAEVLRRKLGYSAVTTHAASPDYDDGPLIAEIRVPVRPGDTPESLFARVQHREKRTLPHVIGGYLDDLAAA